MADSQKKTTEFRKEIYKVIGKTSNPLAAFVARPAINLENQLNHEEIILLLRKHPITQVKWFFIGLIMLLAPTTLSFFPLLEFLPTRFQLIVVLIWYLMTLAFALEKFLSWYFNVYIITDERVIDVDFYNLLYKEISDAEIENIEDVTLTQGGVMQNIFNYGMVQIQTAAERPEFEFEDVPNPALVVKVLKKMQLEEKQEILEGRIN
ncbi:MAG: PH domain-containing protein [Patescibacteria group bacterium]